MPRTNTQGGKKKKRGKNGLVESKSNKIQYATDFQVYGTITKIIGGGKFNVLCYDNNNERICRVRGNMRKKIWLNHGDTILIALRDFGNMHDIIYKYNIDDVLKLKSENLIPSDNSNCDKEVDFVDENRQIINDNVKDEFIQYNDILSTMISSDEEDTINEI